METVDVPIYGNNQQAGVSSVSPLSAQKFWELWPTKLVGKGEGIFLRKKKKRLARMSFLVFSRINCYTELEKSIRESIQK